eukprot:8341378-Alexandrium_andersonii.AAC.1
MGGSPLEPAAVCMVSPEVALSASPAAAGPAVISGAPAAVASVRLGRVPSVGNCTPTLVEPTTPAPSAGVCRRKNIMPLQNAVPRLSGASAGPCGTVPPVAPLTRPAPRLGVCPPAVCSCVPALDEAVMCAAWESLACSWVGGEVELATPAVAADSSVSVPVGSTHVDE